MLTGGQCSHDIIVKPNSFFIAEPYDKNREPREQAIIKAIDGFPYYIADKDIMNIALTCKVCRARARVKEGMKFIIYEEGDLILDPETRAPLEKLELVKGRIEITNVQEKISIGESFTVVSSLLGPYLSSFLAVSRTIAKRVEINLTEEDIIEPQRGPIIVGDLVRQVIPSS